MEVSMNDNSSLEERRRKNIERNQQFLLQLFASQRDPNNSSSFDSPTRGSTNADGRNITSNKKRPLEPESDQDFQYRRRQEKLLKEEQRSLKICQELISFYPERAPQIQQLSEYLSFSELLRGDEFASIVAYGPVGVGKSTIFWHLLQDRLGENRIVRINCLQLSTVQDLLWTIQTSLAKYFTDVYRLRKLPVWKRGRNYTVVDLANFLRNTIVLPTEDVESAGGSIAYGNIATRYFHEDDEISNDHHDDITTATTYLLLENISHIIEYDSVFASLADLGRIAERRFQLFATMDIAPTTTAGMLPMNFVLFPPYSIEQLRSIISRSVEEKSKWPASASNATDTGSATEERGRLCHQRLERLLLQSMESLALASSSIDLLISAISSLWLVVYGETPAVSYARHRHHHEHSSSALSNISDWISSTLPMCSQGLILRIVQEMIRRNRFNFYPTNSTPTSTSTVTGNLQQSLCYNEDVVYHELRQMVLQHFQNQQQSNPSASITSIPTTAVAPATRPSSTSPAILPMEQHIQTLPYHLRVILVAAFLAGHRGKAQDSLYDPTSQVFKRRRHTQAGSSSSSSDHANTTSQSGAGDKDMGTGVLQSHAHGQSLLHTHESALPNRELFTYERLSALYAHVLAYCQDMTSKHGQVYRQTASSGASHAASANAGKIAYAKPTLQSLVTRLEMYGLLQAMPTVLPSYHPQRRLHSGYRAMIARQVALAAAENIGFPIESFVYSSYDFQPTSHR